MMEDASKSHIWELFQLLEEIKRSFNVTQQLQGSWELLCHFQSSVFRIVNSCLVGQHVLTEFRSFRKYIQELLRIRFRTVNPTSEHVLHRVQMSLSKEGRQLQKKTSSSAGLEIRNGS